MLRSLVIRFKERTFATALTTRLAVVVLGPHIIVASFTTAQGEAPTVMTDATCRQVCEYETFFHRAHCDQRDLSFVPISTGCEDVSLLELQGNDVKSITKERMSGYTRVRTLDISRNQISSLEPGTFQSNHHLRNFIISYNKLEVLRNGTFNGMETHLQRVYMDNNKLKMIERGAFEGLGKLKTIFLGRNLLKEIPEGLFAGLHALEQVNLSSNRLVDTASTADFGFRNLLILDVQNNVFNQCASILPFLYNVTRTLYFAGNPFLCDCNCKIIQKWFNDIHDYRESGTTLTNELTCIFSNGTYANVTESLELNCDDNTIMDSTTTQTLNTSHYQPAVSDAGSGVTSDVDVNHTTSHGKNMSPTCDHADKTFSAAQENRGETFKGGYRSPWASYYTAIILTMYLLFLFGRWACKRKKCNFNFTQV